MISMRYFHFRNFSLLLNLINHFDKINQYYCSLIFDSFHFGFLVG